MIEKLTLSMMSLKNKHTNIILNTHLRANGQSEKTNEILCEIITKIVQNSMTDWDSRLLDALWAHHTTYKVTTKFTPFRLVYGQETILPVKL